jgi:hypothetical protein
MIIELTEYQASILHSSVEQTIITMRDEKKQVSLVSSLAIESGIYEYLKLKTALLSCWTTEPKKEKA